MLSTLYITLYVTLYRGLSEEVYFFIGTLSIRKVQYTRRMRKEDPVDALPCPAVLEALIHNISIWTIDALARVEGSHW
jgi:hypothetical protein